VANKKQPSQTEGGDDYTEISPISVNYGRNVFMPCH